MGILSRSRLLSDQADAKTPPEKKNEGKAPKRRAQRAQAPDKGPDPRPNPDHGPHHPERRRARKKAKKGPGRPRSAPHERRDYSATARLTEWEMAAVDKACAHHNLGRSAFMRLVVFGFLPPIRPPA